MTATIRLSTMDAAFLLAETRETPMHVAGLQVFKVPRGAPNHFVSQLYAYLRRFPVTAEPFNYRLTGGVLGKLLPSWEIRNDVDLDYHLRFSALPSPGGERELGVLVSRLHSIPMDLARPLWEFHLIERLAGNRFAIYVKLHHALVDGVSAMRLMTLLNDRPDGFAPPVWAADLGQEFAHRPPRTHLLERASTMLREELKALPSLYRGMATVVKAAAHLPGDPDFTSMSEAPRTMFNVRVGAQRRVATHRASLARVKAIGRAAGGTVNDVVLAACAGALRRYLQSLGELPEQPLIAVVPVALPRGEGDSAGNAVSSVIVRLGTNLADVRERFEMIRRTSVAGKAHLRRMTKTAILNYTMITATPVLLETWLPDLAALAPPLYNVLVSNVPGPQKKLYFHGAEMEAWFPVSQVGQGQALNITVISYAGELAFGFVACPDCVPRVQRLAVHMGEALDELEETFLRDAGAGPAKSARPKRPARSAAKSAGRRRSAAAPRKP